MQGHHFSNPVDPCYGRTETSTSPHLPYYDRTETSTSTHLAAYGRTETSNSPAFLPETLTCAPSDLSACGRPTIRVGTYKVLHGRKEPWKKYRYKKESGSCALLAFSFLPHCMSGSCPNVSFSSHVQEQMESEITSLKMFRSFCCFSRTWNCSFRLVVANSRANRPGHVP